MAVYPAGNPGVVPIDGGSDVGKLRYLIDDTAYEPYDPPVVGWANFTYFSDAALQTFIDLAAGDLTLASGYAYQRIAATLTIQARTIQTDDLRLSTEARAESMRKLAWDIINGANDAAGNKDIFHLAFADNCKHPAELAEHCWRCGIGSPCYC